MLRETLDARLRQLTRAQVSVIAAATGMVVMAIGARVETGVIAAVGATGHQLEWISDVIAAVAVTVLTYLWLHLRASRLRLLDLERAEIARDAQLRLGAEIQRDLLPPIPATTAGYAWSAHMETASEVGGDFYDFFVRDDGTVVIILGDVSGKGIPAALLQSSLLVLFRVHASRMTDPAAIARHMSDDLYARTGGRPYATALLARFDPVPQRVTYVNAGHPPGLIWRGQSVFELRAGGPPLGLFQDVHYEAGTLDLRPGDVGVLVTDGITEALEGAPLPFAAALPGPDGWQGATPSDICERLLRRSRRTEPGVATAIAPPDDRTVLAFAVRELPRSFERSRARHASHVVEPAVR